MKSTRPWYFKYVVAALRRIWYWSPDRKEAKKAKFCAACRKPFGPLDKKKIDHIDPVVEPKRGFVDWNTYIARLMHAKGNLQALCDPCHKVKTKEEGILRRKAA